MFAILAWKVHLLSESAFQRLAHQADVALLMHGICTEKDVTKMTLNSLGNHFYQA